MEKEVDPAVLAVINEKRLLGEKLTPVEIIARMGVFDARAQASEQAWLATGGNVIAPLWAEFVSVGATGRWFYLESLDTFHRIGGGERTELQQQRAKDRLKLLKSSMDAGLVLRTVLQTNRVAIANLETDKAAKVSVRTPDDEEWHVASWDSDDKIAVLVRGERGWLPSANDMKTARERGSVPKPRVSPTGAPITRDEANAGAFEYIVKYFAGYGYKPENVTSQHFGYDVEVSDKKGNTLLKVAVKGMAPGTGGFALSAEERARAKEDELWRLAVVTDAVSPAAQHKLYKGSEIESASGIEPLL